MGYDLLNEPWPGSVFPSCISPAGCPAFDATTLTDFTKRVIASIRKVDHGTLAFYEPLLTFDFGAETSMGDTGDENAGFSFHDYCLPGAFGGPGSGDGCEQPEDLVFQNADARADQVGDALLLSEFGASNDLDDIWRIVILADDHMTSWQYWHYCACDDPTTSGPGVQALVVDASKPPRGKNVKWRKLKVLDRPYPQAVAGTPKRFGYDPDTNTFHLAYSTRTPDGARLPRRLATVVYLPRSHYPDGFVEQADGANSALSRDRRYLRLRRFPDSQNVSVTISPAVG